jgi:hypothetical protein
LRSACELGGKTLAVALANWFLSGLRYGRRSDLPLTSGTLRQFAVLDRSAKYRALRALEKKGLIRVRREPGKNPLVTILLGGAGPAG